MVDLPDALPHRDRRLELIVVHQRKLDLKVTEFPAAWQFGEDIRECPLRMELKLNEAGHDAELEADLVIRRWLRRDAETNFAETSFNVSFFIPGSASYLNSSRR
jgi:hypothetical protein